MILPHTIREEAWRSSDRIRKISEDEKEIKIAK